MDINPENLPAFDIMIAGFPCQTFSVIGQRTGMKDERGQIIYGLIDIMKAKILYFRESKACFGFGFRFYS